MIEPSARVEGRGAGRAVDLERDLRRRDGDGVAFGEIDGCPVEVLGADDDVGRARRIVLGGVRRVGELACRGGLQAQCALVEERRAERAVLGLEGDRRAVLLDVGDRAEGVAVFDGYFGVDLLRGDRGGVGGGCHGRGDPGCGECDRPETGHGDEGRQAERGCPSCGIGAA